MARESCAFGFKAWSTGTPRDSAAAENVSPVSTSTAVSPVSFMIREQDHIAVSRTDFNAVAFTAKHMGGGHSRAATEEWIEHDVADIAERQQEELNQRAGEGSGMRALAALGLHLNDVARPRDASEPAIFVAGV